METLVGVAILALLAAVVIPAAYQRIGDSYVKTEANVLSTLSQAINTYHDHVGSWPSSLTQLVSSPQPGATNICGTALAAKDTARWLGPYVTMAIPTAGIVIDDDTIVASLTRSTTPAPTTLQITVKNVDVPTKTTLESTFDGSSISDVSGTIRYTTPPPVMTYNIPITGC